MGGGEKTISGLIFIHRILLNYDNWIKIGIMDKETKKEFDNLGVIIKRGFDDVYGHFDSVDKRFEQIDVKLNQVDVRLDNIDGRLDNIDGRLDHIDVRLSYIERDIAEIRKHFVYRDEFEDLAARVKYLEEKLKIKSGK